MSDAVVNINTWDVFCIVYIKIEYFQKSGFYVYWSLHVDEKNVLREALIYKSTHIFIQNDFVSTFYTFFMFLNCETTVKVPLNQKPIYLDIITMPPQHTYFAQSSR